jgi:hypothetical protein
MGTQAPACCGHRDDDDEGVRVSDRLRNGRREIKKHKEETYMCRQFGSRLSFCRNTHSMADPSADMSCTSGNALRNWASRRARLWKRANTLQTAVCKRFANGAEKRTDERTPRAQRDCLVEDVTPTSCPWAWRLLKAVEQRTATPVKAKRPSTPLSALLAARQRPQAAAAEAALPAPGRHRLRLCRHRHKERLQSAKHAARLRRLQRQAPPTVPGACAHALLALPGRLLQAKAAHRSLQRSGYRTSCPYIEDGAPVW